MEKKITAPSGLIGIFLQIITLCTIYYLSKSIPENPTEWTQYIVPVLLLVVFFILFGGYMVIQPNNAVMLSFLGNYKGTIKQNGFLYRNPFFGTFWWSLAITNHETEIIEINDKDGVPIEIAATITYKIGDTYKSQYDVDDVSSYIGNQFNISLRKLAKHHTYAELSTEESEFTEDLTEKVSKAGVEIIEAKITHLAYSEIIAASMLQKQQAKAVGDAKEIIVDTAVGIAQKASDQINFLSDDIREKFVANLIVTLCSDKGVTPTLSVQN